jgi:hypothetical protein
MLFTLSEFHKTDVIITDFRRLVLMILFMGVGPVWKWNVLLLSQRNTGRFGPDLVLATAPSRVTCLYCIIQMYALRYLLSS